MKKTTATMLALGACLLIGSQSPAQDNQQRQPVILPADAKAIFLAQMLGHMVSLDAIVAALGKGDYPAAANVAAVDLGVSRFQDAGAGAPKGPGLGIGKHLPEEFRAIGGRFRQAANDFADLARTMPAAPDGTQQRELFAALAAVTRECRVCHDSYRIE